MDIRDRSAGAARILADVGDIARFPDRNHFASWTGTAPIDASSGEHTRHRLSRAGNRRSTTCSTWPASPAPPDTPGRACYRRKRADRLEPGEPGVAGVRAGPRPGGRPGEGPLAAG